MNLAAIFYIIGYLDGTTKTDIHARYQETFIYNWKINQCTSEE